MYSFRKECKHTRTYAMRYDLCVQTTACACVRVTWICFAGMNTYDTSSTLIQTLGFACLCVISFIFYFFSQINSHYSHFIFFFSVALHFECQYNECMQVQCMYLSQICVHPDFEFKEDFILIFFFILRSLVFIFFYIAVAFFPFPLQESPQST